MIVMLEAQKRGFDKSFLIAYTVRFLRRTSWLGFGGLHCRQAEWQQRRVFLILPENKCPLVCTQSNNYPDRVVTSFKYFRYQKNLQAQTDADKMNESINTLSLGTDD